jgi:hypothetical protein
MNPSDAQDSDDMSKDNNNTEYNIWELRVYWIYKIIKDLATLRLCSPVFASGLIDVIARALCV